MKTQNCPICNVSVNPSGIYPNYVCLDCEEKAVNKKGLPVKFFNTDFGGGFVAVTNVGGVDEESKDNICFVNGIKCFADEGIYGGIIILPIKE